VQDTVGCLDTVRFRHPIELERERRIEVAPVASGDVVPTVATQDESPESRVSEIDVDIQVREPVVDEQIGTRTQFAPQVR
jgi:hypothetical protein